MDLITPELERNLPRLFEHNQIIAKHLAMANGEITQIRVDGLKENRGKLPKALDLLTLKLQRINQRAFEQNQIVAEHLAMVNDTITQIWAESLKKNQGELSEAMDLLTLKLDRHLERIFEHNQITAEYLPMVNDTITQFMAAHAPQRRQYAKRQVKPLIRTAILNSRDANRSIASRKAKDAAAQERKLQKQGEKVHGKKPPPAPTQESDISIEAARVAEEN